MLSDRIRRYLTTAPLGRLSTVDEDGQPHVVPVCFALSEDHVVTAVDEKEQTVAAERLRRVKNIQVNPRVALVVDHYSGDWSELGWVQIRGTAALVDPAESAHDASIDALEEKYPQYQAHDLSNRPLLRIVPTTVRSWGELDHTNPL